LPEQTARNRPFDEPSEKRLGRTADVGQRTKFQKRPVRAVLADRPEAVNLDVSTTEFASSSPILPSCPETRRQRSEEYWRKAASPQ
jgi:hypothetical protein